MALMLFALGEWRSREVEFWNKPGELPKWQQWKAETERMSKASGPVQRRPVKTDEPPSLILMRDYFGVIVAVSILVVTVLFGFVAFVIRGSVPSARLRSGVGP